MFNNFRYFIFLEEYLMRLGTSILNAYDLYYVEIPLWILFISVHILYNILENNYTYTRFRVVNSTTLPNPGYWRWNNFSPAWTLSKVY